MERIVYRSGEKKALHGAFNMKPSVHSLFLHSSLIMFSDALVMLENIESVLLHLRITGLL